MRENELRIGNWVKDSEGRLCTVIELRSYSDFWEDEIRVGNEEGVVQYPINPIPLTEEWLLKFGLNKPTNKDTYHFKKNAIEYYWVEGQGLKLFDNIACIGLYPCDYVHQLQNLYYALTGEELKIKEL